MIHPIGWSGDWRCLLPDDRSLLRLCVIIDVIRRAVTAGQRVIVWVIVLVTVIAAMAKGMDLPTALAVVAGTSYAAQEIARWAVGRGRPPAGGGASGSPVLNPLPAG